MSKKVIQVPIEEDLLGALDKMSKKRRQSRSGLIREACQQYLEQIECEELDRLYTEGYKRLPEEPSLGQAQAALANQVLPQEPW
jgi:metal-responsive CopG/Arc/MetJ family transcriptional regulator